MNVNNYLYTHKSDLRIAGSINGLIGVVSLIAGGLLLMAAFHPEMGFGLAGHVYMGIPLISVGLVIEGLALSLFILSLFGKKTKELKHETIEESVEGDDGGKEEPKELMGEYVVESANPEVIKEKRAEEVIVGDITFDMQQPIPDLGEYTVNEPVVSNVEIDYHIPVTTIDNLPDELLVYILKFLSTNRDVISCLRLNKRWNALCNEPSLSRPWAQQGINIRFFRQISTQPVLRSRLFLNEILKKFNLEQERLFQQKLVCNGQSVVFRFNSKKVLWVDLTNTENSILLDLTSNCYKATTIDSTHFLLQLSNQLHIFDTQSKSIIKTKEFQSNNDREITVYNEIIYLFLDNVRVQIWNWQKDVTVDLKEQHEIPKEFDSISYIGPIYPRHIVIQFHVNGKRNFENYNVINLEEEIKKKEKCIGLCGGIKKRKNFVRIFSQTISDHSFYGKIYILSLNNNDFTLYSVENISDFDLQRSRKYLFTHNKDLLIVKDYGVRIVKENKQIEKISLSNIDSIKKVGKVIYAITNDGDIYLLDLKNLKPILILKSEKSALDFNIPGVANVKSDNSRILTRIYKEKIECWNTSK